MHKLLYAFYMGKGDLLKKYEASRGGRAPHPFPFETVTGIMVLYNIKNSDACH